MIRRRNEMRLELKERMRDGEGTVSLLHLVEGSTMKNARLLSEVTIPPGASIGEHRHDAETEYYIILEGEGTVIDNGVPQKVHAGDVVITGDGASHSIKNTGTIPLKLLAVIITY
ncbi:MAG TPA: cupin domain-containing protein [Termitinemataceae bacterium]|nr:cupin domain-containing protein [Termitinemataceae bacterium]HOM24534.1 cupin domain-containing protein [Termitinemataceae bacterium]HPQ00233.1 cupin domain-containing protein [Termitinemataceae bacterium]